MTASIRLAASCIDRDLLQLTSSQEVVRFVSFDDKTNLVSFTQTPCTCTSCTVGYTRHGDVSEHSLHVSDVCFPVYNLLHYWDPGSAVTHLFRYRSGLTLDTVTPRGVVFDGHGAKHHT